MYNILQAKNIYNFYDFLFYNFNETPLNCTWNGLIKFHKTKLYIFELCCETYNILIKKNVKVFLFYNLTVENEKNYNCK